MNHMVGKDNIYENCGENSDKKYSNVKIVVMYLVIHVLIYVKNVEAIYVIIVIKIIKKLQINERLLYYSYPNS